jgi:threonine dehydratase
MLPATWLTQAAERIQPHIVHTPLTYDAANDLFVKWESYQVTGSFKARGALNKALSLQAWEYAAGLATASAGNHGLGVALAARLTGCPATVFVPEQAVPLKVQAIQALGAQVRFTPGGYAESELAARQFAAVEGAAWISAYNDGQVIAGQATIALEALAELPQPDSLTWIVPVGGGGLAAGIGAALGSFSPGARVIGVQAANSPFFHALYRGAPQDGVVESPTLADGLAGAIEDHSITIPLARRYLEEIVLVSEAEIIAAIRYAWEHYGEPLEPSAAAALAAALSGKIPRRPAVVIASGGNIQPELLSQITALPAQMRD